MMFNGEYYIYVMPLWKEKTGYIVNDIACYENIYLQINLVIIEINLLLIQKGGERHWYKQAQFKVVAANKFQSLASNNRGL